MFAQDVFFNDVQVLDATTLRWSEKCSVEARGRRAVGDAPSKRAWHAAALGESARGRHLYVHGGVSYHVVATTDGPRAHRLGMRDEHRPRTLATGDVHRLCLETWRWERARVAGEGPGPRFGHTAAQSDTNEHLIYFFGGRTMTGTPDSKVWILDTTRMQWSSPPTRGVGPCARYAHAAAVSGGDMVIFGGSEFTRYCAAHLFTLKMKERPPATPPPRPATPPTPCYRIDTARSINRGLSLPSVDVSGRTRRWPSDRAYTSRTRDTLRTSRSTASAFSAGSGSPFPAASDRGAGSGRADTSRTTASQRSGLSLHLDRKGHGHTGAFHRARAGSGLWPASPFSTGEDGRAASRRSRAGSRRGRAGIDRSSPLTVDGGAARVDGRSPSRRLVGAGKNLFKSGHIDV
jgi:hypothetical protein